jgi:hypothetical protein
MSDSSDLGPGVGDDSSELASSPAPYRERKMTPAAQVAAHFESTWHHYISRPEGNYHSMATLFDSKTAFMKRVKDDLLGKESRSVNDIGHSFGLFCDALGRRQEELKPGQSVWKLWWVRRAEYLLSQHDQGYSAGSARPEGGWDTELRPPG